jgi:hypothetical protein
MNTTQNDRIEARNALATAMAVFNLFTFIAGRAA